MEFRPTTVKELHKMLHQEPVHVHKGTKLGKAWRRSIRAVMMVGDAAAKAMFPTRLVSRLTRDELIAKAKGLLPSGFNRLGMTVSKKALKRDRIEEAKVVAPVIKTATAKAGSTKGFIAKSVASAKPAASPIKGKK